VSRRTIALFGGSFNPPHVCHVLASAYVLACTDVDALWWMPVGRHPFDKDRLLASAHHRLAMCRRAAASLGDRVQVSDFEIRRGGVNHTVDTLEALRATHPDVAFRLVVGADVLAESAAWKDFDRVVRLAPLIVIGRQGHPTPPGVRACPPLPDVRSSTVRARLRAGLRCDHLVPASVLTYIEAEGLYGVGGR